MKQKFTTLIFLCIIGISAIAQCPFGNGTKVNCVRGCGRFIDENNDEFCDNGLVQRIETEKKDTIIIKKDTVSRSVYNTPSKPDTSNTKQQQIKVTEDIDTSSMKTNIIETPHVQVKSQNAEISKPYPLISISGGVLLLYLLTITLVKTGKIKKITHRKIWNTVLLVSFVFSCFGGFYLIVQLNYSWRMDLFPLFLKIHVWTGIVMTLVGIIHILWHLPYFRKMISQKTK